jgi:hypothetical protein
MPSKKNISKIPRKINHVDCGLCKRFESECKAKGFLKINYMPECKKCEPIIKVKTRNYDNANRLSLDKKLEIYARSKKVSTEEKRAIAIMAARPSARQGNGHK